MQYHSPHLSKGLQGSRECCGHKPYKSYNSTPFHLNWVLVAVVFVVWGTTAKPAHISFLFFEVYGEKNLTGRESQQPQYRIFKNSSFALGSTLQHLWIPVVLVFCFRAFAKLYKVPKHEQCSQNMSTATLCDYWAGSAHWLDMLAKEMVAFIMLLRWHET